MQEQKKRVGGVSKIVFLNNKGQEVFQNPSYSAMVMEQVNKPYPFSEGLARYHNQGKFGYINSSGRIAIPRHDDARDFSEGLAAVKVSTTSGARWGFIDMTGKWVIPAKFSNEPYPFIEGFFFRREKPMVTVWLSIGQVKLFLWNLEISVSFIKDMHWCIFWEKQNAKSHR